MALATTHSDYRGATACGMHALLVRRPGPAGEEERKEADEDLTGVQVVSSLDEGGEWVRRRNAE